MNRRDVLKAAVAVPIAVATGAVVAREALYGMSGTEMLDVLNAQVQMSHWQRELLRNLHETQRMYTTRHEGALGSTTWVCRGAVVRRE